MKVKQISHPTRKFFFLFLFITIFLLFNSFCSKAESYIGVQAGGSIGSRLYDLQSNNNTNSFNQPNIQELLKDTRLDNIKLDESFTVGGKIGHYFDKAPFLGVEGEFNYSRPEFKQNLTLNNPYFGNFQDIQLKARVNDFAGTVSVMARYPRYKRVMPYVGIGPSLHYFTVKGSGRTGAGFGLPFVRLDEQDINVKSLKIGLQAKTGIRVSLTKHLALDAEYRFNYAPFGKGLGGRQEPKADYISHQIVGAVVYKFGNIKW